MKVGVVLPTFRDDAEPAVERALEAERAGLDGVFVYDHLWPMGRPERPALHWMPVLGAVAAATARLHLGPLVARVGLVREDTLVDAFATLRHLAGHRLVAGLGTGDRLNAEENLAYGLDYPPAGERRAAVAACARRLGTAGVEVWVGGSSSATRRVARATGSAVNLWQAGPEEVAAEAARGEVTWGGTAGGGPEEVADHLVALEAAGATWAVLAPPDAFETVVTARQYLHDQR